MEDANLIELDLGSAGIETLELFMNEAADDGIFEEIVSANQSRPEVLRLVYEHPNTPDDVRERAASVLSLPVLRSEEVEGKREEARRTRQDEEPEARTQRLVQQVQHLSVAQKIKMALRGNPEVRGILARDPNKMVVMSVLENPRVTEGEVEALARNRSVVEEALRAIAKNREWTKSYAITLALVNNPKTPAGVAVRFIPGLKKRDLSLLEKNKNVSEAVRSTAKKFVKRSRG